MEWIPCYEKNNLNTKYQNMAPFNDLKWRNQLLTHLVGVHALIVDLDLTLLAVEAGFVEKQLLGLHHLRLKDLSKASRAGVFTTTKLRWIGAFRGWDRAGRAVLAVHLLVLPNKHLAKLKFKSDPWTENEETWSLSVRGLLQVLQVKHEEWKWRPFSTTSSAENTHPLHLKVRMRVEKNQSLFPRWHLDVNYIPLMRRQMRWPLAEAKIFRSHHN